MNPTPSIRVEMKDGLAVVSLSQAERGNPFDGDFMRDFKQVLPISGTRPACVPCCCAPTAPTSVSAVT